MEEYVSWEDLLEEDAEADVSDETETSQVLSEGPKLEDLLATEELPDELKALLREKQQLEHQMKVLTGQASEEDEADAYQAKRFPVKVHTKESRLEDLRQKRRDERQQFWKQRRLNYQKAEQRRWYQRAEQQEAVKAELLKKNKMEDLLQHRSAQQRAMWQRHQFLKAQIQARWLARQQALRLAQVKSRREAQQSEEARILVIRETAKHKSLQKQQQQRQEEQHWQRHQEERNRLSQERLQQQRHERDHWHNNQENRNRKAQDRLQQERQQAEQERQKQEARSRLAQQQRYAQIQEKQKIEQRDEQQRAARQQRAKEHRQEERRAEQRALQKRFG